MLSPPLGCFADQAFRIEAVPQVYAAISELARRQPFQEVPVFRSFIPLKDTCGYRLSDMLPRLTLMGVFSRKTGLPQAFKKPLKPYRADMPVSGQQHILVCLLAEARNPECWP